VTKDEFIQQEKVALRRETRRLFVWLVLGWGVVIVLAFAGRGILNAPQVEAVLEQLVTTKRHLLIAGMGIGVLALAAALRALRPPESVKCPHCGRSIFGFSARIALLTCNCGFCGERIIA
jgi:hypothetical protein